MEPVRCFTCAKVISPLYHKYCEMKLEADPKTDEEILDQLKVYRACCRTNIITCVSTIDRHLRHIELSASSSSDATEPPNKPSKTSVFILAR